MDKEKEIEEMEKVALRSGHSNDGYIEFDYRDIAEYFYEAGYRKADEMRKETAKEIWNNFKLQRNHFDDWEWEVVKLICRTNGVGVDE